jgi:hypothetical protein
MNRGDDLTRGGGDLEPRDTSIDDRRGSTTDAGGQASMWGENRAPGSQTRESQAWDVGGRAPSETGPATSWKEGGSPTGDARQTASADERQGTAAGAGNGSPQRAVAAGLPENEVSGYREQWRTIQATFVDDPRTAVAGADGLVVELTGRLTQLFSEERQRLEEEWAREGQAETEGLRMALQHYRSFFEALLER